MTKDDSRSDGTAMLHDNTNTPRDVRKARGEALRIGAPYETHAGWSVPADRSDPLELLKAADDGRLSELIPIRYGRMSKTPFTFFRGSAAVMASDLAKSPNIRVKVQACGDSHALNFGAFATPERNVVFDLNDFDETLPGWWEWDLKRLVVSLVLIARDNGLKHKVESEVVQACVRRYREEMRGFASMPILDIWYARIDYDTAVAEASDVHLQQTLEQQLLKEQKKTIKYHYFPKMVQQTASETTIKDNPPLIYHPDSPDFVEQMKQGLELYRESLQDDKQRLFDRYKLCDIAIKVVGVGSVGTTCAIALLLGPDDDPLFLQIKEARASVLEPYVGKSTFDNHGQRVVAGQRIIQSASDIFLGWMRLKDGRDFYVRQLRDTKVKLNTEDWGAKHLVSMGSLLGAVLARAHARSGDSAVISGYLGETDAFDMAIADFAISYTNQVEKDHAQLVAAIKSGRIKADPTV